MLVVPGVLVMGSVVLLAVAPHANLHLLFLVPSVTHGSVLATPCFHRLGTRSYNGRRKRGRNLISKSGCIQVSCSFHALRFFPNINEHEDDLPDLCWPPHPDPGSLLSLLGSSLQELLSLDLPQADVPLSTFTGGAVLGSLHDEDSFCWGG